MLSKTIDIAIDTKSWGRKPLPRWVAGAGPIQQLDVAKALLMLGSITTPNALSPGSPERYWACLRYFSACTRSMDLRIRTPFLDLDPHQKGILSDDFGVALSTYWLQAQLGGVRDIVDGRRFSINMGVRQATKKLPKVGNRKCPDFVLEDLHGKFHVLECKGTQSGRAYLDRAMRTGSQQKMGIKVHPAHRGERLVIGVSLAGEGADARSEIVVKDPEFEPITEISKNGVDQAEEVMRRLSLARALNLTGFPQAGFEIAWPEGLTRDSPEMEFLSQAERKTLSRSMDDRSQALRDEIYSELDSAPRRSKGAFVTQEVTFDLSPLELEGGTVATAVRCRRGVRRDLLLDLAQAGKQIREAATHRLQETPSNEMRILFSESKGAARIEYGGFFFSEVIFEE